MGFKFEGRFIEKIKLDKFSDSLVALKACQPCKIFAQAKELGGRQARRMKVQAELNCSPASNGLDAQ